MLSTMQQHTTDMLNNTGICELSAPIRHILGIQIDTISISFAARYVEDLRQTYGFMCYANCENMPSTC